MAEDLKGKWQCSMIEYHLPVMVDEVTKALRIREGGWYLDATVGDGGHSLEILKRGGKVFGIDCDPEALVRTNQRFQAAGIEKEKFLLKEGNFREILNLVGKLRFAGIAFDLGVSRLQIESSNRGFSFQIESLLDMRMSPKLKVLARDLVNSLNYGELIKLFKIFGEERLAGRIAQAVVSSRPIETTTQLAKVVTDALGGRKGKIHPATRVFQALRIAINDELSALREALPQALDKLDENGRLCVISFHSLEDRIVKNLFRDWQKRNLGEIVTSKPIRPSQQEIFENRRARSGKLRVFEKL